MAAVSIRQIWSVSFSILLALGASNLTLCAGELSSPRQVREFTVVVDGQERGLLTMDITSRPDQTETVRIETDLHFKLAVLQFHYSSSGTETWKGDRLIGMDNTANYNGRKYAVKAAATRNSLQVSVNGKTSEAKPDVWATSYWRIPERIVAAASEGGVRTVSTDLDAIPTVPVALVDSDKGRVLNGEVRCLGPEVLNFSGKRVACTHYQISGEVDVHLWYDRNRRLLRQESVEQKHKTLLRLTRLENE